MTHFRHGKRWSGGKVESQQPVNPLYRDGGRTGRSPGAKNWWTQERINKLIYIMNTYDDLDKAERVLGCKKQYIVNKLNEIRKEQEENGIKSD